MLSKALVEPKGFELLSTNFKVGTTGLKGLSSGSFCAIGQLFGLLILQIKSVQPNDLQRKNPQFSLRVWIKSINFRNRSTCKLPFLRM